MHERSASPAIPHPRPALARPQPDPASARPPIEDIEFPAAILDHNGIVCAVNEAWRTSPGQSAPLGGRYLDGLRNVAPVGARAALALALAGPPAPDGDVTERTLSCHNNDSEHWITVSISTLISGGRSEWLVLHQNTTALRQLERRCRLTQRLAAVLATPLDPTLRRRRLAVTIGEVLLASTVVLWERAPSGVLRARPLETSRLSPQVATIAHTHQVIGVMDGQVAQWIRLVDTTPCFAVPLRAHEQVVLFHFPHRPRFDADTLGVVARALQSDPSLRAQPKVSRSRSPREIRRQLSQEVNATSPCLALQERQHIERTLTRCDNNLVRTAQELGIARSTLYERIKDYGITVPHRTVPRRRRALSPSRA